MDFSPSQLAEFRNRAQDHFQQGRLREAVENYEQLCRACPSDPAAWHMLGVVYGALGNLESAIRCARQTTILAPSAISGYRNLGHFLLSLGRATEAEMNFRKAVSLPGAEAKDYGNLGAALAAQSCYDEAIISYEHAIALDQVDPLLHYNLAAAFHALERWHEAARHYERASLLAPNEPSYLIGLATVMRANKQDEQALKTWMKVLQLVPNDIGAQRNIAAIYHEYGQAVLAAQIWARIIELVPTDIDALIELGLAHLDLGNTDSAQDCFRRILAIEPRHPEAQYNLALALERSGLLDEALAAYEQVVPGAHGLDLIGARAGILEKLGNFEAAYELLKPVIKADSIGMRALDAYARLCRHFGECEQVIEHINARLQSDMADENEQRLLHFRIGELYDRQKRFDKAFSHFEMGNRLKNYKYNVTEDERYIDNLISALAPENFARLPSAAPAEDITPIFIVGMPRSGTTLVEQILGSHPEVQAGDELPFITRIANTVRDYAGKSLNYPDYLPYLRQIDCEEMAQSYLDELRALADGSRFVTDKMPHNFPYLGLMYRLFPNAPIIHCLRDPIDVCLSCFFQDFASCHNYAYDLTHLGQHYQQYRRVVTYFHDVLQIPMLEIQYEALVDNPDARSRELISYCGLSWDERCLRFYESDRKSKTASYDQVRQPIYKRSRQRWRNYEKHLRPLFNALDLTP